MESVQSRLSRVRPPRVKITYDVETGGAIEKVELPWVVGILADLSFDPEHARPAIKDRVMVDIDRDNFDAVLAESRPRINLEGIPDVLSGKTRALAGYLSFSSFSDFEPGQVVNRIPVLKAYWEARGRMRDLDALIEYEPAIFAVLETAITFDGAGAGQAMREALLTSYPADGHDRWRDTTIPSSVAQSLAGHYPLPTKEQTSTFHAALGQFTNSILVALPKENTRSAKQLIVDRVAEMDAQLSAQLSEIMHSDGFQQLEATWRGIHYLVFRSETSDVLKLRILNLSKAELFTDLVEAGDPELGDVLKRSSSQGSFEPLSMLVGGYEFQGQTGDVELLEQVAEMAADLNAPFISSASCKALALDQVDDLLTPRTVSSIFDSHELSAWRTLRQHEYSQYIALTLPRVLMRLPYGDKTMPAVDLSFEEDVTPEGSPDLNKLLWGNSAYILAERVTHAFSLYGWPAAIDRVEGGGLVEGLPIYTLSMQDGDFANVSVAASFTPEGHASKFDEFGLHIIYRNQHGNGEHFYFQGATELSQKIASAHQKQVPLPCLLAGIRFAHFVEAIHQERAETWGSVNGFETYLQNWIAQYVLLDDDAPQEAKAAYPLASASIRVSEDSLSPGHYEVVLSLQPHFQLEGFSQHVQVTVKLQGLQN